MSSDRIRKAIIIFVAMVGVAINILYGIGLIKQLLDPQFNNAIKDILIAAIALEFGWAAMLLLVVYKPYEMRLILLFTAISMMLANILHCIKEFIYSYSRLDIIALNLIVGLIFVGLFILAFFLGKSKNHKVV